MSLSLNLDIGSKLYTVTDVRGHFKHRGEFLLTFSDYDFLLLCASG